jgi:hypothetical protein
MCRKYVSQDVFQIRFLNHYQLVLCLQRSSSDEIPDPFDPAGKFRMKPVTVIDK